ncbi:MAG: GH1 family beta-glucosidase [Trueperaceae bacterium]|nr:GH1 family beta-glucosidase [Trueperaceae bacterium]
MADHPNFPPNFIWGTATAAYQIEGAAREDGRGPSIWDVFSSTPGKTLNGDTGEVACDHYHRWEQDFDLMNDIGVDAYRFSVAWPRIIPQGTGEVNEQGLDFYDRLVDGMLERGIKPFCTLYHWDLPQPLQDQMGWANRAVVDAFVRYADVVTKRLGDRVSAYATLNEPWCSAELGYIKGEHAPGLQDRQLGLRAAHHLLLAHGSALPVMRANAPEAQHGIVLNFNPSYPASDDPEDVAAARRLDGMFNRWYLDPVLKGRYPDDIWQGYGSDVPDVHDGDLEVMSGPIDFLGVNYYSRAVLAHDPDGDWPNLRGVSFDAERTDMGWEVYPEGLSDLLRRLEHDYDLPPVYITENGAAYPDKVDDGEVRDEDRISYIRRHLEAVSDAMAHGVDVRGYFAWSLMDNFEWAFGYSKRFGLVYVDYETLQRIPKHSAHWYRDYIEQQKAATVR